ncbi:MAG: metallophosphoesterase [Pseudobdellovibrionaceae bacterium]
MRIFKCTVLLGTHMSHFDFTTIGGDILFHCGDITNNGKLSELKDFACWLERQNYAHKILIGGNHDYCMQDSIKESRKVVALARILQNEVAEIDGLKIFGSPYSVR